MEINQLLDRYPALPDGSTEIEREQMNLNDVRFAARTLRNEAFEAFSKAETLNHWWRQKRKAERAAGAP